MQVQIEGTNLVRDIESKALLNTDRAGLNKYLMDREIAKRQQKEQAETKLRLSQLEEDMSEIKSLLRTLVQSGTSYGS